MRNAMFASVAALGLAACATPPGAPTASTPSAPGEQQQCVAEAGAWAVGQAVSDELVAKLQSDTHSKASRVLRPNQPMTLDYRHDRVNVMLDDKDKVARVTCG